MFVRTKILQLVSFRWILVQANLQKRYKLEVDGVGKNTKDKIKRGKNTRGIVKENKYGRFRIVHI